MYIILILLRKVLNKGKYWEVNWILLKIYRNTSQYSEKISQYIAIRFSCIVTPLGGGGRQLIWHSFSIYRPIGVRELRKIQLWLCQFIFIEIYLSRFLLSGNEIFYTILKPSFCDDCLMLGTLKLLFPKKTFVTIWMILKAGVFTMITLNLSDIFDSMNSSNDTGVI